MQNQIVVIYYLSRQIVNVLYSHMNYICISRLAAKLVFSGVVLKESVAFTYKKQREINVTFRN